MRAVDRLIIHVKVFSTEQAVNKYLCKHLIINMMDSVMPLPSLYVLRLKPNILRNLKALANGNIKKK